MSLISRIAIFYGIYLYDKVVSLLLKHNANYERLNILRVQSHRIVVIIKIFYTLYLGDAIA